MARGWGDRLLPVRFARRQLGQARGRRQTERSGGLALRVNVDQQDALSGEGQRSSQADGCGGLAHATFGESDGEFAHKFPHPPTPSPDRRESGGGQERGRLVCDVLQDAVEYIG